MFSFLLGVRRGTRRWITAAGDPPARPVTKADVTFTLPGEAGLLISQVVPDAYAPSRPFPSDGRRSRHIVASVRTPDAVLAARIRAGDAEALAEVFRLYGAVVFGVARRATADRAMAEDVVQEVFCALWSRPEGFDAERGSLRAYLCGIAYRRGFDVVRRDTRRVLREQRSEARGGLVDSSPDADLAEFGTVEAVRKALERLPDDQRQVVELVFWKGRTNTEIAEDLGIPAGTVKSRLRLARAKLVHWLAELTMEPA